MKILNDPRWATLSNGWKAIAKMIADDTVQVFVLAEWMPKEDRPDDAIYIIGHGKPEIVTSWGDPVTLEYFDDRTPVYNYPYDPTVVGYNHAVKITIDGHSQVYTLFTPETEASNETR